jgi:hypothetical protein
MMLEVFDDDEYNSIGREVIGEIFVPFKKRYNAAIKMTKTI